MIFICISIIYKWEVYFSKLLQSLKFVSLLIYFLWKYRHYYNLYGAWCNICSAWFLNVRILTHIFYTGKCKVLCMSFGLFNLSFITILNYRLRENKDEYKLMEMDQQKDELSEYVQYNVIHIILLCTYTYVFYNYVHT